MDRDQKYTSGARWLYAALAVLVLAAACGGDEDAVDADPSSALVTEACGDAATTDSSEDPSMEQIDLETTDFTQAEKDTIALYRRLVGGLAAVNPATCKPMAMVSPAVPAAAVGAFEAMSFEHGDPLLRYDAFLYPNRQVATDAGAREAVGTAIEAATGATEVNTIAVGGGMFIVRTSDVAEADADTLQEMTDFYDAVFAGDE